MPDVLDANGLQIKTSTEIRTDFESAFRAIFGNDINIDQNSPDGQLIGIFTQACTDIREKLLQIYNSFDPDRAIGRQLDERVVINNIQRAGGTFTIVDITITVNQTLTLQGLDAAFNDVNGVGYTVQDNAGTKFILIDTTTLVAGSHVLPFRAQQLGQVETTINTITTPVTVVIGVTSITNATAPTNIGQNEETDLELRTRRQRSVANASNGYLNGLLGFVLSLEGVTDAVLYENVTNTTDGDGIPAHGIWLVVEGGAITDIANAIYSRKSFGANMKGAVDYDITTASGQIFTAKFDRPVAQDLYVRFDIQKLVATHAFDEDVIKQTMVNELTFTIGQFVDTSRVTAAAVKGIDAQGGAGVPINAEVSTDGTTWFDFMNVATKDKKWALDATRITISSII